MDYYLLHPKTLQEAVVFYSNPDNALAYMTLLRWPDGVVVCPTCGRNHVVFLHNQRKWQCKSVHSKRQFSAKVGTIFEDSPIALEKWLVVVWMLSNCRNGISSYEVARAIGVTQKSAWFMLIGPVLRSTPLARWAFLPVNRNSLTWREGRGLIAVIQSLTAAHHCASFPMNPAVTHIFSALPKPLSSRYAVWRDTIFTRNRG